MAVNQLSISERFHLDQVPQSGPQLTVLLRENADYLLSAAELLDTDHEGERIYRMVAPVQNVQIRGLELSGGRMDGTEEAGNDATGTGEGGGGASKAGVAGAGEAGVGTPKAGAAGTGETGFGASAADGSGAAADALAISETGESGTGGSAADGSGAAADTLTASDTKTSSMGGAGTEASGAGVPGTEETAANTSAAGEAGTGKTGVGSAAAETSGTGESAANTSAAGEAGAGISGSGEADAKETKQETGAAGAAGLAEAEEAGAQTGSADMRSDEEDLYVLADGHVIGRIRPEDSLHFRNLARNYKITGMEIRLHGGAYRVVREEADGTVLEDQGIARWSAVLTVYRRVPRSGTIVGQESISAQQLSRLLSTLEQAQMSGFSAGGNAPENLGMPGEYGTGMGSARGGFGAGSGGVQNGIAAGSGSARDNTRGLRSGAADGSSESLNRGDGRDSRPADRYRAESDGESGWIDTSYATVTQEKDPSGRGMFFLLLAAVVSVAYLCFSVPAWIPSLAAGRSTLDTPVIRILGLPGYVPGAVLGVGLLLNIIAMFTAGGVLPTIGSLLYVAAGFLAPSCLIFTLIPAGLCLLGAFCKKKGIAALRIILGIATVAAASFLLYQHVSGMELFNPFKNRELTDIESVRAFMSGDLPLQTDEFEYESASEYYEDESEWVWDADEEETDLEDEGFLSEEFWDEETEEEGDFWEDESDLEEGILFEMETDEDGNYVDREAGLISADGITWEALDDDEEAE